MSAASDLRQRPRVNSDAPFRPLPLPARAATVIQTDVEAIAVAHRLAEQFATGAAEREGGGGEGADDGGRDPGGQQAV